MDKRYYLQTYEEREGVRSYFLLISESGSGVIIGKEGDNE